MSTSEKNEYMLLFRGNNWHKGLSPEEMQKVMSQWMGWFERLSSEGKVTAGDPLESEARIVSKKNGQVVVDGIFAESKEAIAGFFRLKVDSLEEAEAIAKECPGLDYGTVVEVRPVAEHCQASEGSKTETHLAAAGA